MLYVPKIKRHTIHKDRDVFVVGDIHGGYSPLMNKLISLDFDFDKDLLFSVGDLVDRGNENEDVIDTLSETWFEAALGNHEHMLMNLSRSYAMMDDKDIEDVGCRWFYNLKFSEQEEIVKPFYNLPLAHEITIVDDNGDTVKTIGIVHAEVPNDDWSYFVDVIDDINGLYAYDVRMQALYDAIWKRDRIINMDTSVVKGIDEVYVGHSTTRGIVRLGNVTYTDTRNLHHGSDLSIIQISGNISYWKKDKSK